MKERKRLYRIGCILIASIFIMTACGKRSAPAEMTEAYEEDYAPSAKEISDALDKANQETIRNEVISGDVFEFYIDSDVNIVKLQMPANYVKEGAEQTGSFFETEVDTTGEWRGHYEIRVAVYSMEQVKGPLDFLESRFPDVNSGRGIPRVAPHGDEGTYKSIYETRTSDTKMHGEKTIGFGFGSNETAAVLLVEVITNYREFGEYNGINEVLDSILLVNVDDDEARPVIDELEDEYEKNTEEKMKDAVTITNEAICSSICKELGIELTDKFTLEQLEEIREIDFGLLREEDSEWMPYLTNLSGYVVIRGNDDITNLHMFKNWSVAPYEEAYINITECDNLTSLDGIEEIRFSEGAYLEGLSIGWCPNLTDISALKEIGICECIYISLTDNITEEMIADVYYSNPNIGGIKVSEEVSSSYSRVIYDLRDNQEEFERRKKELLE